MKKLSVAMLTLMVISSTAFAGQRMQEHKVNRDESKIQKEEKKINKDKEKMSKDRKELQQREEKLERDRSTLNQMDRSKNMKNE